MLEVCYQPSSSSKRSLSARACTRPLFITTYTVPFSVVCESFPDVWNIRTGGPSLVVMGSASLHGCTPRKA